MNFNIIFNIGFNSFSGFIILKCIVITSIKMCYILIDFGKDYKQETEKIFEVSVISSEITEETKEII